MSGYDNPPQFQQPGFPPPAGPPRRKSPKMLYWVVGCLGVLLLGAVALIAIVGLAGYGAYQGVTNSEALKVAETYVSQNPAAKAEFGDNIQFAGFPTQFNIDAGKGTAQVDIGLTGSKGAGTAHVELTQKGDQWSVSKASIVGPSGKERSLT